MTASPISLTISIHESATHPLPQALLDRLNCPSPTKDPEELKASLSRAREKSEKIRAAHIDAVRDRAARETQRAADAAARKLRLAASRVDKVQRKLVAAETKTNAKKEAAEAARESRKAKREALSQAVLESRRRAAETKSARQAVLLAAEHTAATKHSKAVKTIVDKSAWQVKHAIAVAAAQREKERSEAAAAGERLTERLESAAGRREVLGSPSRADNGSGPASSSAATTASSSSSSSPSKVLHRVLNDDKVTGEMRRKLNELAMGKAADKRAKLLADIVDKASAQNARVASVVAALAAKGAGTDAETAASKAALYERLNAAEVSRHMALKASKLSPRHGDTVSVIVVKVNKVARTPPPALSLRLSSVSRGLVATSVARQLGAASRRTALRGLQATKAALANEKRAQVVATLAKRTATLQSKIDAKATRSMIALAIAKGGKLHAVAQAAKRAAAALRRRHEAAKDLEIADKATTAHNKAALERHRDAIRATAKAGVVAVRAAANKSRRDAKAAAITTRGAELTARGETAAARRSAFLAARVTIAKRRMVAPHPKREVEDAKATASKEAESK